MLSFSLFRFVGLDQEYVFQDLGSLVAYKKLVIEVDSKGKWV